ncbi:CoA pyrophosphatase [Paracoccaceae bacterium]|nr:CoA pyrophosphatase [Paracoccaceae bacterium]
MKFFPEMHADLSNQDFVVRTLMRAIHSVDYHNDFLRKKDTTFDTHLEEKITSVTRHPASVLVPLHLEDSVWQVTLTRRSMKLKKHRGQISFPGGKFENQDKSLINTALREASEEIGLNSMNVNPVGSLPSHETVTGFTIYPFVGIVNNYNVQIKSYFEVSEIFCVPLNFLLEKRNYSKHLFKWQGEQRSYLAIPYGPYYIWGATARILFNLADMFYRGR